MSASGSVSSPCPRSERFGRSGASVLQREHRGRPRAHGRDVAATRIISIIGRKNAGKDDADRRAGERARAPGPPGHDHEARPPPGPGGSARRGQLAALPRRTRGAGAAGEPGDADALPPRARRSTIPVGLAREYLAGADIVLIEGLQARADPQDRGVPPRRRRPADLRSGRAPTRRSGSPSSPTTSPSRPTGGSSASTTPCGSSSWRISPGSTR